MGSPAQRGLIVYKLALVDESNSNLVGSEVQIAEGITGSCMQ